MALHDFPIKGRKAVKNRPKRLRKGPVHKWSEQEQNNLLDFVRKNLPIEKPNARLYYQRFLNQSKIAIEGRLVRSKVRNLRVQYTKAKCWQSSTEAMSLSEEIRRETVLKMCNFFDVFEDISNRHGIDMQCSFKSVEFPQYFKQSDSKNDLSKCAKISSNNGDSDIVRVRVSPIRHFQRLETHAQLHTQFEQSESAGPDIKNELELSLSVSAGGFDHISNEASDSSMEPTSHKKDYSDSIYKSSSINCESDELNSRLEMNGHPDFEERKLALEIEKFHFEKEKFCYEKEKDIKMQELRKWELESHERLKKLEIQMQERIAMQDLNIKERVAIMKLKRNN
ncbi:uncharacterized protein LOC118753510 [Rhagoletis pomonella]|uniref:uncharacterized protein LOC118753510 n=1 Tax=Rhagoletis pomonella TaxID=28610 RepID=UPI001781B140|nr:uncharacterized protein LOC118753510 [Rhagoletis pomonella]